LKGGCKAVKNERYYFSIMDDVEKQVYKAIYDGLRTRTYSIEIPLCVPKEKIQEIYLRVLYDNPLMFYVNQTIIRISGKEGDYSLLPEYIYTEREIKLLTGEVRGIVDKIHVKADAMGDNMFRIEKYLHDSVVKSVPYDYEALKQKDCFNAHSVIGAFIDRKAVCEGVAKAFKLLCNEFSMKCIVVYGQAGFNGDFSGDNYHAWNLVKVGRESYYVDATWDNKYDREISYISYDYFNMTTEDLLKDHRPDIAALPICTDTRLNYFYATNSIVNTYGRLVELIKQRISESLIMFKAELGKSEFSDVEDFRKKSYEAVMQAARESGVAKTFALMFNEIHGIGKIFFLPE